MSFAFVSPVALSKEDRPDMAECWAAVERAAGSRLFQRASRPRDFLLYVARRAVKEGCAEVREQEIGAEVFGRRRDYDTSQDNIVRVNASDLRRRLLSYYASEGAGEAVVIEIPRGAYAPMFRRRALEAEPVAAAETGRPPDRVITIERTPQSFRWALRAALTAVAVLSAICVGLVIYVRRLESKTQAWDKKPVMMAFWRPFLTHRQRTDVVLADTGISLIQDITGQNVHLPEYLNRSFFTEAQARRATDERRTDLGLISSHHYTSLGAFQVAYRVLSLERSQRDDAIRLHFARDYPPEAIKDNNVILIGGRRSNPWVELFEDRLNFSNEHDSKLNQTVIVNRAPRSGEQARYGGAPDPSLSDGYCVVAFLPSPGRLSDALIFSGTNSEATSAGGEFLTSERPLTELRKLFHSDGFPYFEVLLRTKRLNGTALGAEVIAWRTYPRGQ